MWPSAPPPQAESPKSGDRSRETGQLPKIFKEVDALVKRVAVPDVDVVLQEPGAHGHIEGNGGGIGAEHAHRQGPPLAVQSAATSPRSLRPMPSLCPRFRT